MSGFHYFLRELPVHRSTEVHWSPSKVSPCFDIVAVQIKTLSSSSTKP